MSEVVVLFSPAVPIMSVEEALEKIERAPYGSIMVNLAECDINDERLKLNNTVVIIHENRMIVNPASDVLVTAEYVDMQGLTIPPHYRLLAWLTFGPHSQMSINSLTNLYRDGRRSYYRTWVDMGPTSTQWAVDNSTEITKAEYERVDAIHGTYLYYAIEDISGSLAGIKYNGLHKRLKEEAPYR